MTTKPHWLCRLGWHRWAYVWKLGRQVWEHPIGWTTAPIENPPTKETSWMLKCVRPNCKRAEWEEV